MPISKAEPISLLNRINRTPIEKEPLTPERLASVRIAYSARRVEREALHMLLRGPIKPRAGDLVLARVDRLGQHQRIELPHGRRAQLYEGDEIIVCYGNRYAPDQFEAVVPDRVEECHLVAGGGVAAKMLSRHSSMKRPTTLAPLGLVGDADGHRVNVADWGLPKPTPTAARPYTIAVVGTAMNAGKTTTAANLCKGLIRAGTKVGAAKITGTGAGCDRWTLVDTGAHPVLDFTDAGYASTYRVSPSQVENIMTLLCGHLVAAGAEFIVLEVADGLFQEETSRLLASPTFTEQVDGIIFAAGDALGALAGVEWLRRHRLPVQAVSGLLTASPLACREAAATGLPVLSQQQLSRGEWRPDRPANGAASQAWQTLWEDASAVVMGLG
ncbi:MAG: DUF1611 domain-containing protein [Candidatus Competibacteraceae bacterium]|nr:DUF1611 domain-containing protein [Candidatus Competibacteraceae bacterium]MBK8897975.1 DUF1611 domain-containing protein [Candidatus Competibacteraceae bacterium]MBK8961779.1 DUF1611 domain-containing protein [Candidatus Competibacteraceae bacterium]MBK9950995.1 DUF1611 domain-containing protein [Candidatus Competibacteraceae bacterium]